VGNAGTDLPTNVLLYIPLSFLWAELFLRRLRGAGRWSGMLLVLAFALSLSMTIEFLQQFLVFRATSLRDVLANGVGAGIGLLLWVWRGRALSRWVAGWRLVSGQAGLAENLLWAYLALLFLYNLLPLDLTISPVEIFHKWSRGDLILIPFSRLDENLAERIYELGTDVAIWIPVSLLWLLSGKKSASQAWGWSVLAALALEFGQLLVFSRVSDVTDILTAIAGAGLGVLAARYVSAQPVVESQGPGFVSSRVFVLGALVLAWIGLLMAVFWYPYQFELNRVLLQERMALFYEVPFRDYFFGTEFRAVTGVLRQFALYLPLGALLGLMSLAMRRLRADGVLQSLSVLILMLVPFGIELGQVALPGKFPSTGDWMLAVAAGLIGLFASRSFSRRWYAEGSALGEQGRQFPAQ